MLIFPQMVFATMLIICEFFLHFPRYLLLKEKKIMKTRKKLKDVARRRTHYVKEIKTPYSGLKFCAFCFKD